MPEPQSDDPRLKTNLDPHAYVEACKAYGRERERWKTGDAQSGEVACWEACLAALRVYEFERAAAEKVP